jgi:hypothetical protein
MITDRKDFAQISRRPTRGMRGVALATADLSVASGQRAVTTCVPSGMARNHPVLHPAPPEPTAVDSSTAIALAGPACTGKVESTSS